MLGPQQSFDHRRQHRLQLGLAPLWMEPPPFSSMQRATHSCPGSPSTLKHLLELTNNGEKQKSVALSAYFIGFESILEHIV
jgi:hypothetical protein